MKKKVVVTFLCGLCNEPFPTAIKCKRHEAKCDGLGYLTIKWDNSRGVSDNPKIVKKIRNWLKHRILYEDWQRPSEYRFDREEGSGRRFSETKGIDGLLKIADSHNFDSYDLRIAFSGDAIFGIAIEKRPAFSTYDWTQFLILTSAGKPKVTRKGIIKKLMDDLDKNKEGARASSSYDD
jgi:hypothetical protein